METILEKILIQALRSGATDIHINKTNKVNVQFRIKGNLENYQVFPIEEGTFLINYLKFLANIDLNYRLIPQTGHFEYPLNSVYYSFRVSSIPTINKDNLVIRILHHGQLIKLKELTPQKEAQNFLESLTQLKSGLVIICGPTGEGKSTTLHALLQKIKETGKVNIITLEDPIEIVEPAFIQIQINFEAGINFEESLKQILRHDPDVVMIGEIRDEISAALAVRCALTGCLVLSTLHSKNCLGAIKRLENLKVSTLDLSDTLEAIISQRLIHQQKKSFAVYEWLDEKQINELIRKQEINYLNFIKRIEASIKAKETRIEDYEKSEFNTKLFID